MVRQFACPIAVSSLFQSIGVAFLRLFLLAALPLVAISASDMAACLCKEDVAIAAVITTQSTYRYLWTS
jgi:hypothetical protein